MAEQQQQIAEGPTRSKAPYEVSDELRPRIDALGLRDAVDELREEGYPWRRTSPVR